MSKIIYIAGLGHSGSTILDMSLGTVSGVVGLGELKTLMDDHTRDRHYTSVCSCGKKATDCMIWKDVPTLLKGKKSDPDKIETILNLLRKNYGKEIILVDSSKNSYAYLKYLHDRHDLRVIYLTRDVRSWSYSRHLATGKPVLYYFFRWLLENLKLRSQLKKMGITPLKAGYEELALFPEYLLKRIAEFTDLEYADSMLSPGLTNSHIISGNVARADALKRMRWIYDARWMVSRRMMLLSPFFLLVHKMNRSFVFSQLNMGSIKDFYLFGTRRKEEISKTHN